MDNVHVAIRNYVGAINAKGNILVNLETLLLEH